MSTTNYFDLSKIQNTYTVAYGKFKEYMAHRVDGNTFESWVQINIDLEMGMKNTVMAPLEGYLMNFFNKYDIKIGLTVDKLGEWTPRVYMHERGVYKSGMTSKYTNRNEAIHRAFDSAFAKLNIELIINSKSFNHEKET